MIASSVSLHVILVKMPPHPSHAQVHVHAMIVKFPQCKCPPWGCNPSLKAGQHLHHGWKQGCIPDTLIHRQGFCSCSFPSHQVSHRVGKTPFHSAVHCPSSCQQVISLKPHNIIQGHEIFLQGIALKPPVIRRGQ